jgi:hypothetical protein
MVERLPEPVMVGIADQRVKGRIIIGKSAPDARPDQRRRAYQPSQDNTPVRQRIFADITSSHEAGVSQSVKAESGAVHKTASRAN